MLENYAVPQLEELQPDIIFQQDDAPPHPSLGVRGYLDAKFPGRWIGHGGSINWPPRSPDMMTPLDFLLWGFLKDFVYQVPVRDMDTLRARIIDGVSRVTSDMLANTWCEIEFRLSVLRATKGVHVEVK